MNTGEAAGRADGQLGAAQRLFGPGLPGAYEFAALLGDDGARRGVIGPREADRIWERHLLNCAAVAELIPRASVVVDVGSGAGLPGIPLALARPDLRVTLVDSMKRRVQWLEDAVAVVGLESVHVEWARAEECAYSHVDVVTARAVAPLGRLARSTLPLLRPGGNLLAIKGAGAEAELRRERQEVQAVGGEEAETLRCGVGVLEVPTTVVRIRKTSTERGAG